jgi:HK97 family phage major capsid protein
MNTDAENFVREDLTAVVARGVDLAAIAGTGLANQPLGIAANPAVPTIPLGTDGGPLTWEAIVALETAVAAANADVGSLAYMTNAKVRGKLKTTPKVAAPAVPLFLWNDNAGAQPLNGYPCHISNQVPGNLSKGATTGTLSAMLFGNWADLVLAFWSGMDVIVDPYTGSSAGTLRIVVLQDVDVNIRHAESFGKILDVATV